MIKSPVSPAAVTFRRARRWLLSAGLLGVTALAAGGETAATVAAKVQHAIDGGHPPAWWTPELPDEVRRDVERKGVDLAARAELEDPAKTKKVAALVAEHFGRVWAWHQQVDPELDAAWDAWDAARDNSGGKEKDEMKALTIMTERIDPLYAQFAPQVRGFLEALKEEVGEEAANRMIDHYTRSPGAKRTYDAYVAMVPEMTEEEKAVLWGRLVQAREDSLAAWSGKRIVKIFKKYKVRNEFSIDHFGYGYRKRYKAWAEGR